MSTPSAGAAALTAPCLLAAMWLSLHHAVLPQARGSKPSMLFRGLPSAGGGPFAGRSFFVEFRLDHSYCFVMPNRKSPKCETFLAVTVKPSRAKACALVAFGLPLTDGAD